MSEYPHAPSGYPYGAPPGNPYAPSPYGPPPGQQPYAPVATPYGAPSAPYAPPPSEKPPKEKPQAYSGGGPPPPQHSSYPPTAPPYGSPFASLVPSAFPPGTDPNVVACFQMADRDGSGFIDDKELQGALSSYNQTFSIRTVHLLMYLFTNSNARKIG